MQGPSARRLADGRLHLQHGPIDLLVRAWGGSHTIEDAYRRAALALDGLLTGLMVEIDLLRAPMGAKKPTSAGPVAARMVDAVWPHRAGFITPMAAVAGAVADHVTAAMRQVPSLHRCYVNNGGDIALHLDGDAEIAIGIAADIDEPRLDGRIALRAADPVRGVATSGRGGRSFSLGIADAVTVLAGSAAAADAAATVIANAVDIDHPAVRRRPARELDPDSDLGDLPVTVGLDRLEPEAVALALGHGEAVARSLCAADLTIGAALWLRGDCRLVGSLRALG
jgi:ApbE superfamily uncharacterized protein (UPF0280 family)